MRGVADELAEEDLLVVVDSVDDDADRSPPGMRGVPSRPPATEF